MSRSPSAHISVEISQHSREGLGTESPCRTGPEPQLLLKLARPDLAAVLRNSWLKGFFYQAWLALGDSWLSKEGHWRPRETAGWEKLKGTFPLLQLHANMQQPDSTQVPGGSSWSATRHETPWDVVKTVLKTKRHETWNQKIIKFGRKFNFGYDWFLWFEIRANNRVHQVETNTTSNEW